MTLEKLLAQSAQPFQATPDSRFYFSHPSIESSRQTVLRAILRSEGPAIVIGGAGFGKSLLAELIADELYQRMDIVMLQAARLGSRRSLLQSILFELKLPYKDQSEGELRLAILDRLEPSPETAPEGVLILVDEAHTLPWKLIDELRLISNFTRNHQPRVKLVLLGNLQLEETLASPQLESFNQRLAARCYLQPMLREETLGYIKQQLQVCQVDPSSVITREAMLAVHTASDGIPRLVNQLMNHAIWLASTTAQSPISTALIGEAWSELQQLPTPWSGDAAQSSTINQVVEFGALSDEPDLSDPCESNPMIKLVASGSFAGTAGPVSEQAISTPPNDPQLSQDWSAVVVNEVDSIGIPTMPSEATTDDCESDFDDCDSLESGVNFFAAFHRNPTADFLSALESCSEDDGWRVKAENSAFPTISVNVQQATTFGQPLSGEGSISSHDLATKMAGLIAEQQQYDAMGMWENDPPLPEVSTEQQQTFSTVHGAGFSQQDQRPNNVATAADSLSRSRPSTSLPGALFGEDFDEEIALAERPVHLLAKTKLAETQLSTESTSQSTSQSELSSSIQTNPKKEGNSQEYNYVQRMELVADALSDMNGNSEQANTFWSVNVVANNQSGPLLEESIEDIVSQLNFSAFTVEPYSVEQIPLQTTPKADDEDLIRRGNNQQVYMMHRPLSESNQPTALQSVDDDRDLLIIEEEIPVSARISNLATTDLPHKTTPYNQLFARLRK